MVVEVNVPGRAAYRTVLGNVENLRKAFSPDKVAVEVVCHGEGIDMLLSHGNPLAARLRKAERSGVVFAACANTLRGRHLTRDRLLPQVRVVDSGVAEVVRRQEAGWAYLKGAY